ncbi:hypothetical protein [Gluconobacter kondonii]|nr:hypothetical protein [Gluconobacter kondonii]
MKPTSSRAIAVITFGKALPDAAKVGGFEKPSGFETSSVIPFVRF